MSFTSNPAITKDNIPKIERGDEVWVVQYGAVRRCIVGMIHNGWADELTTRSELTLIDAQTRELVDRNDDVCVYQVFLSEDDARRRLLQLTEGEIELFEQKIANAQVHLKRLKQRRDGIAEALQASEHATSIAQVSSV